MESGDDSILLDLIKRRGFDEEDLPTSTSTQQIEAEKKVLGCYKQYENLLLEFGFPTLKKELTEEYLLKVLTAYTLHESQDCNRTWHCYWITHSLSLLKKELGESVKSQVVKFLNLCQNKTGGYGGGPGYISHLGATYAAISTLFILDTIEAYRSINRETLLQFLNSLRVGDGSFYMHIGGEIDMRAVYCAVAVAQLTNLFNEDLFRGTSEWISRCQTYEGGFASTQGMEAHGGYTFYAVSSIFLLNSKDMINMKALLRWLANRQMSYEGGFQGCTNKLVDSCYSFLLAGAIAVVNITLLSEKSERKYLASDFWIFETNLLQEYVLICCQHRCGGLMARPQTKRDIYHTCYALCGLSIAQNQPNGERYCIGTDNNLLSQIHPAYNISFEKLLHSKDFFKN